MRMPLVSRLLFLLSAIGLTVGSHLADYFNATHIFNPNWPPHAKFHGGQTLSMSIVLALLTIYFAWKKTADQKYAVLATASIAATYWITQAMAILYPGTAFVDPEFAAETPFPLGLPPQAYVEMIFLILIAIASWTALRRSARWVA